MAINRVTSDPYAQYQYVGENMHPNNHHDPGTWSDWFSNTFLHKEGDMSTSVDKPPPSMTSG